MGNILSTIPFLDVDTIEPSTATECGILTVVYYLRLVIRILQIVIPVALILWGTIDMGKAVIAGDEKKMKEAQKPFVKRVVSAVIVFLIPFLVGLAINIIPTSSGKEYKAYWNSAASDPKCMENYAEVD